MRSKSRYLAIASAFVLTNLAASDVIHIAAEGSSVEFFSEKTIETGEFSLTISAPDGRIWSEVLIGKEIPQINLEAIFDGNVPDGQYNYEILPHINETELAVAPEMRGLKVHILSTPSAHVGTFSVLEGQVLNPNQHEPSSAHPQPSKFVQSKSTNNEGDDGGSRDQVINDDLIVTGSTCIGFDCINGETFSFDTLKLKENNTRITFIDTSTASGFPAGDWQLRANDSASGGADHFSIDWLGTSVNIGSNAPASTPFRVDGSAPTNSIRVSSTGRVGLRTSNPVLDLHIATGNTPGLRLEQNSSSGFTAQTWDIAGNEANFFIRDVTGGSRLPFRIRPGAPTSSIDVAATGNVGIGTTTPSAPLTISRNDGSAQIRVIETNGSNGQTMLAIENSGHPRFRLRNSNLNSNWDFRTAGSGSSEQLQITNISNGTSAFLLRLFKNGDLEVEGDVTANGVLLTSTREAKTDFAPLDVNDVLERLSTLEISQWRYKHEDKGIVHFGPVAEEFHEIFGLSDGKHLNIIDTNGITFAAIQALNQQNEKLRMENQQLMERLTRIESAIDLQQHYFSP